jgi:hypothetical protein
MLELPVGYGPEPVDINIPDGVLYGAISYTVKRI